MVKRRLLPFAIQLIGVLFPDNRPEYNRGNWSNNGSDKGARGKVTAMVGGRLWAESEVGKGSTFHFTVRLPLAQDLPADFGAPIATLPTTAQPSWPTRAVLGSGPLTPAWLR
jgi:hypothetical protein